MKKIVIIALLIFVQSAIAQNSKLIIGKWAYSELHDKSELDETSLQMMEMLFKDLTISFSTNNTMSIKMRKKAEPGTYTFDKENDNSIIAISETGKSMTMNIIKLTETDLILQLDKAGTLVMKRASSEPDATPAVTPKVAATTKQISGKWFVTGSENKKMSEMAGELLKDSYVNFNSNGKYDARVLSIAQSGTWKFGDNNTTIVVDTEDGKGIWSIYAISENELMMQNDTSSMKMTFSRKQL